MPGAWFDQAEVDRVRKALRGLRHTKGRWAKRPLELDPWQLEHIVAPVFGWRYSLTDPDPDLAGTRIVRTVWIEIPRKNGKSTLVSGLAIVLLVADGELGAEVYAAAASKQQAKIIHEPAKEMVRHAPALRGKLKLLADVITVPRTGGVFRAISKLADLAHGLNVSGAVIDEIHVHKTRDLIDALETGTGARQQPLIIFITTADEGTEHSIYDEKHNYTIQCAKGVIEDPTHFGVIWAAEEGDDPFAEATIAKANPGLGTTVTRSYIAKEARKAQVTPGYLSTYRRLHLNIRERSQAAWLDLKRWDVAAGMVTPEMFAGKVAYSGLDLSTTTDLTAWLMQVPEGDGWLVRPLFWLPEERVADIEGRTSVPLKRWAREGFLKLTEGNVIDYAQVRADIKAEVELCGCKVAEVGYDPWNATETVQELEREKFTMVPVMQTYAGLS
jgi:phage terminase large subunit-like protein